MRLPGLQQRSHDGWKRLRILHVSKERLRIGAYESNKTPPRVWVLPGAIRLTVWEVTEPYIWHHGSSFSCHNNTVRVMEHVRGAATVVRARGVARVPPAMNYCKGTSNGDRTGPRSPIQLCDQIPFVIVPLGGRCHPLEPSGDLQLLLPTAAG
jgi:hypothetical protein